MLNDEEVQLIERLAVVLGCSYDVAFESFKKRSLYMVERQLYKFEHFSADLHVSKNILRKDLREEYSLPALYLLQ